MKRVAVIVLILVVVAGISIASYQFLHPEPYDITQDPDLEVIQIEQDTILATINATGRIEPESEVQVTFEMSGVVDEVLVERGLQVTAGTPLARLQTQDLELAVKAARAELEQAKAQLDQLHKPPLAAEVASAEAAVASAEAKLDEVRAGPRPDEVASARAGVASAQAELDRVLAGPSEDDITVAAASLRRAEVALKQAQWAYDQVAYGADVGASPQAAELEQATIDYETALADYNLAVRGPEAADIAAAQSHLAEAQTGLSQLLASPTQAEISAAEAELAQAESNLSSLLEGPDETEIGAAQAAVNAAQVGLEQAELDLSKATLLAPIDGVVKEINVKAGESLSELAAVVLTDISAYHIDIEVDEIDIGRIARGQKVEVAVDAVPDKAFSGQVSDITPGPIEGGSSGIVAYGVTVALESSDPRLLPGMTADATIETQRLENVLVVPNRAVSIDRSSGEPVAYVEKVDEQGNPGRTEIELGLRDETVSQVLSGLEEGDQIVIRGVSRREQLQRTFQGE